LEKKSWAEAEKASAPTSLFFRVETASSSLAGENWVLSISQSFRACFMHLDWSAVS